MAVTYSATLKTNRMQLVADLIATKVAAASTGTATAGSVVIGTAALSGATGVLVTIPLPATPGTVTADVFTINTTTPLTANASATGTAAKAELRNNAGGVIVSGLTVGTSASDIIVNSTSITSGQAVTMPTSPTSTITHG